MSARWILAGLGLLSGCVGAAPPPPGNSSSGEDNGTEFSPTNSLGSTTVDPTTGPTGTTRPVASSGSSVDDTTSTGEPATDAGGEALLVISDGPEYDFGSVALTSSQLHVFVVTNEGDGEATNLGGQPLGAPFVYVGGAFPGVGGNCDDTLTVDDVCTVAVEFSPFEFGPFADTLTLTYDQGAQASRPLIGGGTGETDNLLINPGGEDTGQPPPGWNDVGPGSWVAGDFAEGPSPYQGQNYIYANTGLNAQPYLLQQDVDVSQWGTLIDQDGLSVSFEGYARAMGADDDQHRVQLRFQDGGGSTLDSYSTGWQSDPAWTSYTDQRTAPTGTRTIRVELGCQKFDGQYCDGYFDALDLRVAYP